MAVTRLGQTGPFSAYLAFQAKALAAVAAVVAAQTGAYTWRSTPSTRLKPEKHQWPDLQQIESPPLAQPLEVSPAPLEQPPLPDNPLLLAALKSSGSPDRWQQTLPPALVQPPRSLMPPSSPYAVPGLPGLTWHDLVTLAEAA